MAKPHDALFKTAFEAPEQAAGLFRSILPASISQAISWESMARESGSFIDPDLGDRQSDLLFSARLGESEALLYLLLEHQSTSDPDMPLRMLIYLVRIWERFRKDHAGELLPLIVPVVVSHALGGWSAPKAFDELFKVDPNSIPGLAALVPRFSLLVEDLAHLSNDELKSRALGEFSKLALWALRDARDREQLLGNLGHWGSAFREALRTPHGMQAVKQLMRYIALVSDDLQLEQFRAKIVDQVPEAEGVAMTIAEQMRQEGRTEGQCAMLRKLLALKFGEASAAYSARIDSATVAELERYAERVLSAETIDVVFASSDEDA